MSNSTNNETIGGSLLLLGVVFLVLKLAGVINWSWWIVTLPFWIGPAIALGVILLALLVTAGGAFLVLLAAIFGALRDR